MSTIVQMGRMRAFLAAAVALLLGVSGCEGGPPQAGGQPGATTVESVVPSEPMPEPSASSVESATVSPDPESRSARFVKVIDGDTVETSAGTIRLIGIDSPERGECGHDEASRSIGALLSAGDQVSLVLPPGQNDHDTHGRLLRYVITADGVDLGLMQLEAGNAVARYDATDGYPEHPRQAAYHAAQIASLGPDGSVVTVACGRGPEASAAPPGGDSPGDAWWMQYSSCAKLKKNTAGHPTGPFRQDNPDEAAIYDWFANGTGHRGDGDGDGLACE